MLRFAVHAVREHSEHKGRIYIDSSSWRYHREICMSQLGHSQRSTKLVCGGKSAWARWIAFDAVFFFFHTFPPVSSSRVQIGWGNIKFFSHWSLFLPLDWILKSPLKQLKFYRNDSSRVIDYKKPDISGQCRINITKLSHIYPYNASS